MKVIGIILALDEREQVLFDGKGCGKMKKNNGQRTQNPNVKEIFLHELKRAGLNPIRLGADILGEETKTEHRFKKKPAKRNCTR